MNITTITFTVPRSDFPDSEPLIITAVKDADKWLIDDSHEQNSDIDMIELVNQISDYCGCGRVLNITDQPDPANDPLLWDTSLTPRGEA